MGMGMHKIAVTVFVEVRVALAGVVTNFFLASKPAADEADHARSE